MYFIPMICTSASPTGGVSGIFAALSVVVVPESVAASAAAEPISDTVVLASDVGALSLGAAPVSTVAGAEPVSVGAVVASLAAGAETVSSVVD
jgi:hypothetical protein